MELSVLERAVVHLEPWQARSLAPRLPERLLRGLVPLLRLRAALLSALRHPSSVLVVMVLVLYAVRVLASLVLEVVLQPVLPPMASLRWRASAPQILSSRCQRWTLWLNTCCGTCVIKRWR